jgi:hypothetical protein
MDQDHLHPSTADDSIPSGSESSSPVEQQQPAQTDDDDHSQDIEAEVLKWSHQSQPRWIQLLEQNLGVESVVDEGPEKTLVCINQSNPLRRFCQSVVRWPYVSLVLIP